MMMDFCRRLQVLLLTVACCLAPRCHGFTVQTETDLRNEALKNYSSDVRPDRRTAVNLMLHVTTVAGVDMTNEIFSLSGWWSMRWNDSRLSWTNYPDIPVVQYKPILIWTPVLVVSNSIDDLSAIHEDTIPVRVESNGVATWSPPGLIKVGCTMVVTYFPFDTQTCSVEVTSFGYTIQELDLDLFNGGLSFRYFSPNGEWDLVHNYSERAEYSEDGYTYARVTFYFELERKALYYGLNMLLPVIICAALALCVFILPPESGEKTGYCLTVLLAFMVILTLVAQDLPTTATSTSILEVYIAMVLIMGGLSVVMSIIVLGLYFKPDDRPIPHRVQRLTQLGMRFCCYDSCCSKRVEPGNDSFRKRDDHNKSADRQAHTFQESDLSDLRDHTTTDPTTRKYSTVMTAIDDRDRDPNDPSKPRLHKQQTMHGFRSQNSVGPPDDLTWQTVALVLDGFLLRIYSIFLLISTAVILLILTSKY